MTARGKARVVMPIRWADTGADLLAWEFTELGVELPPVDFETHVVTLVQHTVSWCNLSIARHGAWAPPGEGPVVLVAELRDPVAGCGGDRCDTLTRMAVLYATPRDRGWPEPCAAVVNSCGG